MRVGRVGSSAFRLKSESSESPKRAVRVCAQWQERRLLASRPTSSHSATSRSLLLHSNAVDPDRLALGQHTRQTQPAHHRARTQVSSRRFARLVPPPSSPAPSPPPPRAPPVPAPRSRRPSTRSRRARHSTSQRSTRTSSASRPRATASSMPWAPWTRLSTGRGRVPCGRWCVRAPSSRTAVDDVCADPRRPHVPRLSLVGLFWFPCWFRLSAWLAALLR